MRLAGLAILVGGGELNTKLERQAPVRAAKLAASELSTQEQRGPAHTRSMH